MYGRQQGRASNGGLSGLPGCRTVMAQGCMKFAVVLLLPLLLDLPGRGNGEGPAEANPSRVGGDANTNALDTGVDSNGTQPTALEPEPTVGPDDDLTPVPGTDLTVGPGEDLTAGPGEDLTPEDTNGNGTLYVITPVDDEGDSPPDPVPGGGDGLPNATDVGSPSPDAGDGDVTNGTAVVPVDNTHGEVPADTSTPLPPAPTVPSTPPPIPTTTTHLTTAEDPDSGLVPGMGESTSQASVETSEVVDPPYVIVPDDTTTVNGSYIDPSSAGLSQMTIIIIAGVVGGAALIFLIILIVVCVRRKKSVRKEPISIIENSKYSSGLENQIYRPGQASAAQGQKYRFSTEGDDPKKSRASLPKRTRSDLPSSLRRPKGSAPPGSAPKGSAPKGSAPLPPNPFTGEPTPPRSRPKRPPPPVLGDSVRGSQHRSSSLYFNRSPYGSPLLAPFPHGPGWELPVENNNVRSSPLYSHPYSIGVTPSPTSSLKKKKAPPPPNPFGDFDDGGGSRGNREAVPMTTFGRPAANNLTRPDDSVYHVEETNPILQKPSPHAPLLNGADSEDTLGDEEEDEKPMAGTHERSRSTDYSSSEESSSEDEGDVAVPPSGLDARQNENLYDVPNGNPYAAGVSSFTNRVYDKPKT